LVIVGVDPDPAKAGELRDWAVGYEQAIRLTPPAAPT